MSVEEITLEVFGLRLAARAWGPAAGRPVLALHGWLDNAASFDRLIPLLGDGLRVVALDLPGHGWSAHRAGDTQQHFIDYVPLVFGCADALGWRRLALLGHSMGGGISLLCAGTFPERVERVAAIDSAGPLTATAEETPERVASYIAQHGRWAAAGFPPPRAYADREQAMEIRTLQPRAPLEPEAAALIVARGTEPAEGGGVRWRHDPRVRFTSMLRLTEAHVEAFLRRVRCPVLAILAEQCLPHLGEAAERRLACVADLTSLRLPGNHHLHLNTPEVVADPVARFLSAEETP